jgi:hypothetical protein
MAATSSNGCQLQAFGGDGAGHAGKAGQLADHRMDEHQAQQHPGDADQQRGLVALLAHGGVLSAAGIVWPVARVQAFRSAVLCCPASKSPGGSAGPGPQITATVPNL